MSEHDHDRLEEFFRKASIKPDVPFSEEDWKKMEARLDAANLSSPFAGIKSVVKMAMAIVAAVILLFTGAIWVSSRYDIAGWGKADTAPPRPDEENHLDIIESDKDQPAKSDVPKAEHRQAPDALPERGSSATDKVQSPGKREIQESGASLLTGEDENTTDQTLAITDARMGRRGAMTAISGQPAIMPALDSEKVFRELIVMSPATAEKIKQRAHVDLPGAEEGDTGAAQAIVTEEDASVKQVVTPRLSLLLSFAPDFSSTSDQYSAPGRALGALLHYHMMKRWSISAGVIKNNKKYTGDGEDYQPPKGYWKYYTNGIIPNSIDGSCSILEFPLMLQYTLANNGKHRWLAGAGTSSYLMLTESYRYSFAEPNPGAKEGWASKGRSRFYLNMVNVTVGYERQLFPGLMVGLEPYVKIPVEAIGWSNIKLFSMGASFTLRYKILGRKSTSIPAHGRGPD